MKRLILASALFVNVLTVAASDGTPKAKGYNDISNFVGGAAVANHADGKYYLVDGDYERLSERGYDYIAALNEGWSVTSLSDGGRFGFMALDGKVIGELDYDMVRKVNNDLFECLKGGEYFLVNKNGERIDNQVYDNLQYILSGGYFVANKNGLSFTLDKLGKPMSDKQFKHLYCLKDGLLVAWIKNEWYQVTPQGEKIEKIDLKPRIGFNKFELGVLQAVRRCIIVDSDMLIFNDDFEDILEFSDRGLFRFRNGNKMGYIDSRGRIIVEAEECIAYEYSDGLAVTYDVKTDRSKVYTIKGNLAFDTSAFTEMSKYHDHASIVRPVGSELYGLVDNKGHWICGAIYAKIKPMEGSIRKFVATTTDGTVVVIDKTGEVQKK